MTKRRIKLLIAKKQIENRIDRLHRILSGGVTNAFAYSLALSELNARCATIEQLIRR